MPSLYVPCNPIKKCKPLTGSQFGKPFGFLKEGADVSGMQTVIHSLVRYAAVMGVFSEWHPLVIRLQQAISSKAETGIAPLFKFVAECVAEWHQSSEQEKLARQQKADDDAPLGADFLGSLLAQHRKHPEKVKEEDTVYHLIPQIGAGGETTGIVMTAGIHFLCEHPQILEKLRVEVDAMRKKSMNDKITLTEARECPYLQVGRLLPPEWLFSCHKVVRFDSLAAFST